MEQNNTYNQSDTTQNEDFVKLQQWLSLCISKWHWFLTSMIVVGGLRYSEESFCNWFHGIYQG